MRRRMVKPRGLDGLAIGGWSKRGALHSSCSAGSDRDPLRAPASLRRQLPAPERLVPGALSFRAVGTAENGLKDSSRSLASWFVRKCRISRCSRTEQDRDPVSQYSLLTAEVTTLLA